MTNKLKVIVAGSRGFTDYNFVKERLNHFLSNKLPNVEIVSGHARGVDTLGEIYAKEYNLNCKIFPADWNTHGKAAGPIRNQQMSTYADALIAFKTPESRGTLNMIKTATKDKLIVRVIEVDSPYKQKEETKVTDNLTKEQELLLDQLIEYNLELEEINKIEPKEVKPQIPEVNPKPKEEIKVIYCTKAPQTPPSFKLYHNAKEKVVKAAIHDAPISVFPYTTKYATGGNDPRFNNTPIWYYAHRFSPDNDRKNIFKSQGIGLVADNAAALYKGSNLDFTEKLRKTLWRTINNRINTLHIDIGFLDEDVINIIKTALVHGIKVELRIKDIKRKIVLEPSFNVNYHPLWTFQWMDNKEPELVIELKNHIINYNIWTEVKPQLDRLYEMIRERNEEYFQILRHNGELEAYQSTQLAAIWPTSTEQQELLSETWKQFHELDHAANTGPKPKGRSKHNPDKLVVGAKPYYPYDFERAVGLSLFNAAGYLKKENFEGTNPRMKLCEHCGYPNALSTEQELWELGIPRDQYTCSKCTRELPYLDPALDPELKGDFWTEASEDDQ